jgi:hypothetical protein
VAQLLLFRSAPALFVTDTPAIDDEGCKTVFMAINHLYYLLLRGMVSPT